MNKYDLNGMRKKLKKQLDTYRYRHTLGVMYTAAALAMCYGLDLEQAQTAGLLHDCAKCIPDDEKIALCQKNGIEMTPEERKSPYLLHAKLGALFAREKYDVTDEQILSAIRYHTTGKPAMSPLEQIIYLADYIEPMREKAAHLAEVRRLAFSSLDKAMYAVLKDSLNYLENTDRTQDPLTYEAYQYYLGLPGIEDGIGYIWKKNEKN